MIEDSGNSRLKALDGIRAFAVFAVFMHHAYAWMFPGGYVGVDIFFVLSGFVITRSLLHEGIDFRRFYWRRVFRIIPPVIPVLLFCSALVLAGFTVTNELAIFGAAASFMNWLRAFGIEDGGVLGHFWSLSVEEQFYLVWPAVLLVLVRKSQSISLWIVGLCLALTLWQVGLYIVTGDVVRVYNALDTRGAQLLMGCLLATIRPVNLPHLWIIPVGYFAASSLFLGHESAFYLTAGIPLAGIMAMILIASMSWSRTALHPVLESRVAQWGGSRSYALYLWHYPLLTVLLSAASELGVRALFAIALAFVATCLFAEISYRLVESPARRMRDKRALRWQ